MMTPRQRTPIAATYPWLARSLTMVALAVLPMSVGCGAMHTQQPRIGQAGPTGLPATMSPYEAMAFGRPNGSGLTGQGSDIDEFLAPKDARTRSPQPATPRSTEVAAAPPRSSGHAEQQDVAPVELAALTHTRPPLTNDAQRYSQRETNELMQYRGGDVLVISASTIVIILLVVLLVVLLT